ncbi:MAG: DUF6460 domain-containing protein [Pseudomonadota bacterium]
MSELPRRRGASALFGGSPLSVLIKLLIVSFVVGIVLNALDINPNDVILWVEQRLIDLSSLSLNTLEDAGGILLLGAVVVVPIWLILRVVRMLGR